MSLDCGTDIVLQATTNPPTPAFPRLSVDISMPTQYFDAPVENNYRGMFYTCEGGVETRFGTPTSCKPIPLRKDYAVKFCGSMDKLIKFRVVEGCSATSNAPTLTMTTDILPTVTGSSDITPTIVGDYTRGMIYTCGDGPETKIRDDTSCKHYSLWKKYAASYCPAGSELSSLKTIDPCSSKPDISMGTKTSPTTTPVVTETDIRPVLIPTEEKVAVDTKGYARGLNYSCRGASEGGMRDGWNSCKSYSEREKIALTLCPGELIGFSTYDPCTTTDIAQSLPAAYDYALANGITTQPTLEDANARGELTRAHMAKMIVKFSEKVLDKMPDTTKVCVFNDIAEQTQELQDYIVKSCQLGLMGVGMINFYPNDTFTRGQFATTFSRALYGNLYEGGAVYYEKHLKALKDADIIIDANTPPSFTEQRGSVWMMMKRVDDKIKGITTD